MSRTHRRLLVLCLTLGGVSSGGVAQAQGDDARFALAGGCYGLKSAATGRFVSRATDGSYVASGAGESFHMQATALGRYLFYGRKRDFMAAGERQTVPVPVPGVPTPELPVPVPNLPVAAAAAADPVRSAAAPSPAADWRIDGRSGAFTISLPDSGRVLAVDGSGHLIAARGGRAARASPSSRGPAALATPRSSST